MDAEIYSQVKLTVKRIFNIDLNYYKDEQMKRRLDSWLVRSNAGSWSDYFQFIAKNPEEQARFRGYLTINVTEFFRDPDRWQMLRQTLLPELLRQTRERSWQNSFRAWSAGCSIGVEAYTLSILLDEVARKQPYSILATDLDRDALKKAISRGPYRVEEIQNLSKEQQANYLTFAQGGYYAKEFLAKPIQFEEQDLNSSRFGSGFDLIVCRNVIIYFTNEAKLTLYKKFSDALRVGGILFLGGTELIPNPKEIGFRNQGYSFYIKES